MCFSTGSILNKHLLFLQLPFDTCELKWMLWYCLCMNTSQHIPNNGKKPKKEKTGSSTF